MLRVGADVAAPYLIDVAVNLTDCVFRGVDWSGKRLHDDDFDLMMDRAERSGVRQMIITGTNLLQCEKAVALCRRYPDRRLLCTVGVHPALSSEFARPLPDAAAVHAFVKDDSAAVVEPVMSAVGNIPAKEEAANATARLARLVQLVEANRDVVVAVGEIGLDYAELYHCQREVQEQYFIAQLRAFAPLGLPFFFHSRECGMRFYQLLEAELLSNSRLPRQPVQVMAGMPQLQGVVHSFNGTQKEQDSLLAMGLTLSLNGSAFRTEAMAKQMLGIPHDRLLLETDAPWCDIRPKDYGYSFVHTHFDTAKRNKPFLLGKCLERRNEPCHMVQVLEAYLGCFNARAAAAKQKAGSSSGSLLTKESLTTQLLDNARTVFRL